MLTLILLSLAAAAQGQNPYPPAAPYPPAVRLAQPVTHVQPVATQSGRLQATHFRSEPYPPAEPVPQVSPSSGYPYPPAQPVLLAPVTTGPYPPPQPSIEGGEISPAEQDSPIRDHTIYSLPSISTLEQLQAPTQNYPLRPEQFRSSLPHYTQTPNSGLKPEQFKSALASYPHSPNNLVSRPELPKSVPLLQATQHPKSQNQHRPGQTSSYPTQFNPLPTKQIISASPNPVYAPYQLRTGQSPNPGSQKDSPSPKPSGSGGEVSPDELEIPPNSQIKLQDKRLQYSHGFSDDKGTSVREQGSLLSTNDGWEYVIAKKGSYSYTSPEGKLINVNYIADHKGFRVLP